MRARRIVSNENAERNPGKGVMTAHPKLKSFNFQKWIDDNQDQLKPPVGNKQLFDEKTGMIIMVVGGPNKRCDFHDDPVEEFFYQLKGDMILKIWDDGSTYDVRINEGDVFVLPPHVRHSPQRPVEGSVGLVVEGERQPGMLDGFEWFCFNCGNRVHRVEVPLQDIVKDLPPLYDAFFADKEARTCGSCNAVHPGRYPPEGWVNL